MLCVFSSSLSHSLSLSFFRARKQLNVVWSKSNRDMKWVRDNDDNGRRIWMFVTTNQVIFESAHSKWGSERCMSACVMRINPIFAHKSIVITWNWSSTSLLLLLSFFLPLLLLLRLWCYHSLYTLSMWNWLCGISRVSFQEMCHRITGALFSAVRQHKKWSDRCFSEMGVGKTDGVVDSYLNPKSSGIAERPNEMSRHISFNVKI